ncbi:M24 family metallopeptidase [Halomonas sp. MCCC 1A17488]|uniref:M24 family metallopeptidase n=1 Tax=Billgrantia sulfidoxydans TaxID=2733484 RepID=A0ABX7W123_9GAMM|nr:MULTISPECIES: M24 family metallopeptidase [Halomonas]MCE8016978.1 M24 family metallopeptidase [Halomonas sp. MCCC 1A17488]MCG3240311.1 M24 family metallopeptidase [Halomonas sp. MCCC 1A17488]QPP49819.1 M24 family metallopeptidase [Halomonas sp. SS10-MC5]QTP53427.1 M24 family metallopeptidase [Halomonas sulfidoxydans]
MKLPSLIEIPNGDKVVPTFSDAEMHGRLKRLREYMAANDVDAVVLTSYHNINYFSDFVYCKFGRDYGLVVTQDRFTTVTANIDGGQPYRRNRLGDNIVYTDWQKDNFFKAVKQLCEGKQRVGVEFDHLTLQNREKLLSALGEVELTDIGVPTMKMRMIKSAEEIALIRQGARVADVGGVAVRDAIKAGVPEYEVALAGQAAMVREIAKTYPHGELMDTWVWFQSGINTDGAHNPVTSRRVQPGDILSLNTFPMISGYYTALERTLFCEHASDEHLRLWEVNCEVHRRGQELIKPGVRCCDIAHELNEIFAKHDLLQYRTFGYGHSFGTLSHYYGREAGLELREDIETVLEPNMVVSMEPMIMVPEGRPGAGGYREHDILVVNEHGAENITGFPYGPEHNIVK